MGCHYRYMYTPQIKENTRKDKWVMARSIH